MEPESFDQLVKNVDTRLTRVEQILPTLATRADLAAAIAPLATKAELAAAIAPLATKAELRQESEQTRRHFDAVAERLEGQIRLVVEGLLALQERMDSRFAEVTTEIGRLDRRVMRLEGARPT